MQQLYETILIHLTYTIVNFLLISNVNHSSRNTCTMLCINLVLYNCGI